MTFEDNLPKFMKLPRRLYMQAVNKLMDILICSKYEANSLHDKQYLTIFDEDQR